MKKKLLAMVMGTVMSVSCVSLFSACTEEKGGNGKIDNFDEWWQAVTESLSSDNYVWNVEYVWNEEPEMGEEKETMSMKRQGDSIYRSCKNIKIYMGEEYYAKLIGEQPAAFYQYFYSNHISPNFEGGYWRKILQSFEGDADVEYFLTQPFSRPYMHNLLILAGDWDIEYLSTLMDFCGVKFEDYFGDEEPTEESVKQNAEEVYKSASYDPEDGSYHFKNRFDYNVAVKFFDGKISEISIEETYSDMSHAVMVINMTFGNADVTLPDEVITSANETAAKSVLAESLNGKYTVRKPDGNTSTLELHFTGGDVRGFGNYKNDIEEADYLLDFPQSFACELISEDTILLKGGGDSLDNWKDILLSIEPGTPTLIYKDGAQEFGFFKMT